MKIIVDAMGGDFAPEEIVKGALDAVRLLGVELVLCGREKDILRVLAINNLKDLPNGVEVVNASETVEMDDDPSNAVRTKKDSSMAVALALLRDGGGEAMVSAGNTGALLAGATLIVKRVQGIRRAALAPVIPNAAKGFVMIDSGANAQCTAEYLLQFAYMGSYYAQYILGFDSPRVGLLNIGTEPSKGTQLQLDAYELIQKAASQSKLNFVGNVEAKEVMNGICDVLVSDGFTGNIMLKAFEGVSSFLLSEFKTMFSKNLKTKLAAVLARKDIAGIKDRLNPDAIGGTIMLGISKPVIKAHGSSNARAITNAIRQAMAAANADINIRLLESVNIISQES